MSQTDDFYFFDVRLAIAAEQWLTLYRGEVKSVSAVADNGKRVQFPASVLQSFVAYEGVHGHFRLFFTDDLRFVRVQRLD